MHYNLFVLVSVLVHNTIPLQLYQTGDVIQAVLESELLRIWPFPPIVLGCRNSSKNMLHTELAARTLHSNNSENARHKDSHCAVAVPWTNKYHTVI